MGKGHHDPVERIEMANFVADMQLALRSLQLLALSVKEGSEADIKLKMSMFEYEHDKLWKYFKQFAAKDGE